MADAEKQTDTFGSKLGSFGKTAGKVALGAVAGLTTALVGAFAATKKVTGAFDDIAKNSRKMGVSTDYYQEMEYWASQNGLSNENMEKSLKRLNQRIGEARNGNEKYSGALQELGIDMKAVEDGTLSTEDAMTQSIKALSEMTNEQDKSALASELFGTKLSQELMPAIDAGALSIEDAAEKAKELGIVIEEDTLNAAEEFNDTWDDLTRSLGAFGQKILAELMPVFQSMMDWVINHMPQIQAVFQTVFSVIGTVFSTATGWIQTFIGWIGQLFTSSNETFTGIWQTIQEVFSNILGFLQETWETILEFWQEHGEQLVENASQIFTTILETIQTVFESIWEVIQNVLDIIVPFIQEQLEKVFQFWDENGEKIMKAVDNVFSFIQGVIEFVMPIISAIIEGAWGIITTIFDTAINTIMGLVDFWSSLLTGDFEGMKEALTGIWESLWDGIKGIVEGAWNLLSGAFGALWDQIGGWFTGLKDDAVDWGKNMISGFIDGIKSMAGKVGDAAKNVVSSVGDFLKFWSPAKKGEGRYIEHWGANMIDGFLDGVKQESSKAGKVIDDMIKSMSPNSLDFDMSASGNVSTHGNMRRFSHVADRGVNAHSGGSSSNTTTNDNRSTYDIHLHIANMNGTQKDVDTFMERIVTGVKKRGGRM